MEQQQAIEKVILSNGDQYELSFPSLAKIKTLSRLLGTDVFADGLKDIRYSEIFTDEQKPMVIMQLCLGKGCPAGILDSITPSDFDLIVTAFFFKAKSASVNLTGELNVLRNFTGSELLLNRLRDSLSMSPSSPLPAGSPSGSIT